MIKVSDFQLSKEMKVIYELKDCGLLIVKTRVEKAWSQRTKAGIIKDNTAKAHNQTL